jgi:hypothetical protein
MEVRPGPIEVARGQAGDPKASPDLVFATSEIGQLVLRVPEASALADAIRQAVETTSGTLAERIKEEMAWRSMTAASLARVADIPARRLRRRLRGESPFLITEWDRLAKALGMKASDLIPENY